MSFLLGSILLYFFFTNFVSVIDYIVFSLSENAVQYNYNLPRICRKFCSFCKNGMSFRINSDNFKDTHELFLTIEIPKKNFKHIKTQYNFAQLIVQIINKIKN